MPEQASLRELPRRVNVTVKIGSIVHQEGGGPKSWRLIQQMIAVVSPRWGMRALGPSSSIVMPHQMLPEGVTNKRLRTAACALVVEAGRVFDGWVDVVAPDD